MRRLQALYEQIRCTFWFTFVIQHQIVVSSQAYSLLFNISVNKNTQSQNHFINIKIT
jgi:hypothetical protein